MAKIFISYKYGDNQVWQGLDQKYWAVEVNPWTGLDEKVNEVTVRAYVNFLEEILGQEHIHKGERQNESLVGKTEDQIWEILKPRVHDSSITLVVISPGMKDSFVPENEQWMPNEIRYSLWEVPRGEKTSATNALLGVILPDRNGSYNYIYERSNCDHCGNIRMLNKQRNPYLFNILKGNIFNRKYDSGTTCNGVYCDSTIYEGDHSYLHLVTLDEFVTDENHKQHVAKALEIKERKEQYKIEKTM